MVYMLKLSWQLHRLQSSRYQGTPSSIKSHTREIIGVVFLVVSPFLFSWIPFVKNMYGISGLWCFIKTASDNGCNDKNFQHLSLTLMMIMHRRSYLYGQYGHGRSYHILGLDLPISSGTPARSIAQ